MLGIEVSTATTNAGAIANMTAVYTDSGGTGSTSAVKCCADCRCNETAAMLLAGLGLVLAGLQRGIQTGAIGLFLFGRQVAALQHPRPAVNGQRPRALGRRGRRSDRAEGQDRKTERADLAQGHRNSLEQVGAGLRCKR